MSLHFCASVDTALQVYKEENKAWKDQQEAESSFRYLLIFALTTRLRGSVCGL